MKRKTTMWLGCLLAPTAIAVTTATAADEAGLITSHSQGLHGYIGFGHEKLPAQGGYSAGMGFYSAVWPWIDQPLADFQIGLPSSWIQPDNSDNKDKPLAPEGTLARKWKERGPPGTVSSKPSRVDWAAGPETTSATARRSSAQRIEAELTKRVVVTVTALTEEYGQASGIPGLTVTIDKKNFKTDAKGAVVWTYEGEPGKKVSVSIAAPGYLPSSWKSTVSLEKERPVQP